jgi:hypothetical protein
MQIAEVTFERHLRTLESRMMGNCQVRFGGGPREKWLNRQLARGLPYFISTDVAYGLTGVGFAAIAGHCVAGRDFGVTLHHGVGALVGGGLCSQVQPAAAALGLSAGALIHLVH